MLTRREFGKLTLAGLALPRALSAAGIDSVVGGVTVGVQTYSFRMLPRPEGEDLTDAIIAAMSECGLGDCELWSPQIEPVSGVGRGASPADRERARDALRRWRVETPLDHFRTIGRKFETAGINVYGYNLSFNDSFSDEEINRGFEAARALGVEIITASATLSAMKRVVPFAEQHRMVVAVHNHSDVENPNEFATRESLLTAAGMSRYVRINLDIGHFTAANYDAVAFLGEHHDLITNLHIKDRVKNQGANVPWGTGDTPIREVLMLLKQERWPIRTHLEYEHRGTRSVVEEVKTCFEYMRGVLDAV
jgi:sugar phosphate isomerase/epimerase